MTKYPSPQIGRALFAAIAGLFVLAGCGKKEEAPPATPAATAPAATSAQPAAAAPAAATAWQPAALDELLAPIALYPDVLLGKILAASQDPQQVLDAGNWLLENLTLKGTALDQAAEAAGFGPQMRALLAFPDVVDMMCQNLDWTTQLGEAFGADQQGVLDSVQRLRNRAVNAGTFKTTPQQKVETQSVPAAGGGTKEVVVVEPAKPEVVYVPKYDPAAVYQPAPTTVVNNYGTAPATTTSTTTTSSSSSNDALVGGLIGFGAGILIANAFHDDDWNDYYRPAWGYGYPPMPPPPMYRPPYGYGGGAYNRPPNYGNSYNRPINSGNTNVNIKVDNDYFNRFQNNPNRPAGGATTRPGTRPPGGAGSVGTGATAAKRPATQGSYAGARPGGGGIPTTAPRVPGQMNGTVPRPATGEVASSGAKRPQGSYASGQGGAGQPSTKMPSRQASAERPQTGGAGSGTPRPTADRGYGGAPNRSAQAKPAQMAAAPTARPAPAPKPAPMPQSRPMPSAQPAASRGGAFNAGGGGADRAASSRGRQSMGGGGGGGGGGRRGR